MGSVVYFQCLFGSLWLSALLAWVSCLILLFFLLCFLLPFSKFLFCVLISQRESSARDARTKILVYIYIYIYMCIYDPVPSPPVSPPPPMGMGPVQRRALPSPPPPPMCMGPLSDNPKYPNENLMKPNVNLVET